MTYKVSFTPTANDDIAKHRKSGDKQVLKRLERIKIELEKHPETGVGNPNRKKYSYAGC
ncbi:hypothetical protein Barb6XT_03168 [Bacteroidales bacterium Barb6XT]|nr:hypothetical protein Barb6XT_03168 [Bacteroidales bacterium Barb6XT]